MDDYISFQEVDPPTRIMPRSNHQSEQMLRAPSNSQGSVKTQTGVNPQSPALSRWLDEGAHDKPWTDYRTNTAKIDPWTGDISGENISYGDGTTVTDAIQPQDAMKSTTKHTSSRDTMFSSTDQQRSDEVTSLEDNSTIPTTVINPNYHNPFLNSPNYPPEWEDKNTFTKGHRRVSSGAYSEVSSGAYSDVSQASTSVEKTAEPEEKTSKKVKGRNNNKNSFILLQRAPIPTVNPWARRAAELNPKEQKISRRQTATAGPTPENSQFPAQTAFDQLLEKKKLEEPHLFQAFWPLAEDKWREMQWRLPECWKWDVEYQKLYSTSGCEHTAWTCTPSEPEEPRNFPLTIAGVRLVIPVDYRWPPMAGVNPPPDPRPSAQIDCRCELSSETIRDIFLTFEGAKGFYLLINGLIQLIVHEDFDSVWASSHLPHKYGGLRVSYITQSMEPTTTPSTVKTSTSRDSQVTPPSSARLSSVFRQPKSTNALTTPALRLNDFIEARPKHFNRKNKFAGRIGLKVQSRDGQTFLAVSSHVVTEAIMNRSALKTLFDRSNPLDNLREDWNDHVEVWAGNEKMGVIDRTFDPEAAWYPAGFHHDFALIKPHDANAINGIVSSISDIGWLSREGWNSLRQKNNRLKVLGETEASRDVKTIKCNRPSDILIVGEGIFLNQNPKASASSFREAPPSEWNNFISRAVLYRVHPDFDPPNGYSGIALYTPDGLREDGTTGPAVVGLQSFVQRSGHVQNFDMEGPAFEKRLQAGRVAFYGAFGVPQEVKEKYKIL